MSLAYSLAENHLTERPDDWSGQAHPAARLDMEATIARIPGRGMLLARTDIMAVLNTLGEVVAEETAEGNTFNLPLFNTSFLISGVFDRPLDSFDPSRHRLNVNLTRGTLLREAERNVKLEKTSAAAADTGSEGQRERCGERTAHRRRSDRGSG